MPTWVEEKDVDVPAVDRMLAEVRDRVPTSVELSPARMVPINFTFDAAQLDAVALYV